MHNDRYCHHLGRSFIVGWLGCDVAIGVWHIATNQTEERCDAVTVRAELAIVQVDLVVAYKAENKANKRAESLSITAKFNPT
ncbi:hypothetical protein [Pseudochelatococcus sp. G4_1912]|uniref:hypothetical protein n=1 Tax=Pseudochelatococcus sp. G4_1912 TaxID=3114288 RepID=UPI0039C6AF3D